MTKRQQLISLILGSVLLNTVPRWLPYDKVHWCYLLYYSGQAASYTLLLIALLIRERYDKVVDIWVTASIWLSISNLMDELFFDPLKLGFNEVIFALIIIGHAVFQYRTYNKSKKIDNA